MKNTKAGAAKYTLIKPACMLLLFLILGVSAFIRMGADFIPVMKWWVALLLIGAVFYPLSICMFWRFQDHGYLFGKGIGIAVSGWFMWLLASLRWMPFTRTNCWISLAVCAILNYGCFIIVKKAGKRNADAHIEPASKTSVEESECRLVPKWDRMLLLELIFFASFLFFLYLKGFNPKAYGTEKMMDYGFMTSIFRTDYFPVNDFWFSGESLNYYYFGQYLMTFLTKLSLNEVSYGYNLALGMGFAFCISFVYALVYQILKIYSRSRGNRKSEIVSSLGGALAALAVTIAGNVHYIVFAKIVPAVWDILQIEGEKPSYWFPNSTRYIGYVPDTDDKTIHEFPSYSFILGDLHAHVINITFVLIVLAVLYAFLMRQKNAMHAASHVTHEASHEGQAQTFDWKKEAWNPQVLLIGFFIGIFIMTNYWDFPIYFVVAGAVILASNAVITGFRKESLILTAIHAAQVIIISQLVSLPFQLNFVKMTNGIAFAQNHTKLYQLFILWGLPVLVVLGFVIALITKEYRGRRERLQRTGEEDGQQISEAGEEDGQHISVAGEGNCFFCFIKNLEISDLYILILGLCAIGLILVPEVIYIVDIYGGSYKRSNTMFKLVYQAFILFGISMGYILTRFVLLKETSRQRKWGIVGVILLLMTCGYFGTSCKAWFGDVRKTENYQGLAADQYIYTEQPADAAAIEWLKENAQDGQVVLEANGNSYTIYNRVSVLTGLPTVLGWHTHEWLWHNTSVPVDSRVTDIQTMYTLQQEQIVTDLLRQYGVSYIFIGSCEYEKYESLGMDVDFLKSLGEVVYQGYPDGNNQIVYIIRVS